MTLGSGLMLWWRIQPWYLSYALNSSANPISVAFSSRTDLFAIGFNDGSVHVGNLLNGEIIQKIKGDEKSSYPTVFAVRFIEGRQAIVVHQGDGTFVWDLIADRPVTSDYDEIDPVFSPDGTLRVVPVDAENTIDLVDFKTRQVVSTLSGHQARVSNFSFTTDCALIATGSWDGTARLWDVRTGKEKAVFDHGGKLLSVAMSFDGGRVVTTATDNYARIWDGASSKLLFNIKTTQTIIASSISRDANHVIVLTKNVMGESSSPSISMWTRRRPELWWGLAFMPDVYLTVFLICGLIWSVLVQRRKDRQARALLT